MLELLDLDQSLPKADYQRRLPELQDRLYSLAHATFKAKIPVVVVFEGWAAAGKGGIISVLTERLDARGFRVAPITPPRTSETRYPWLWRFWLKIPPYGQIAIFDGSWYRRVLIERITGEVKKREWEQAYHDITEFETQLTNDGAVIVKFWLHIGYKEQTKRFKKLLKDSLTAWQVGDEDAAQHRAYAEYLAAAEDMLARTDAPYAPWTLVAATDRHHARIVVYETLIRALEARLSTLNLLPAPEPGMEADDA